MARRLKVSYEAFVSHLPYKVQGWIKGVAIGLEVMDGPGPLRGGRGTLELDLTKNIADVVATDVPIPESNPGPEVDRFVDLVISNMHAKQDYAIEYGKRWLIYQELFS